MVSAAYTSTKEMYPNVRTVCDVAEKGVKTLTTAAVSTAQPILSKLEPQSELRTPRCGGRMPLIWKESPSLLISNSLKPVLGGSSPPLRALTVNVYFLPTVATASEYAHRGLDRLQESLPILQQPTEKVSAKSVDSVLRLCLDLPSPLHAQHAAHVTILIMPLASL